MCHMACRICSRRKKRRSPEKKKRRKSRDLCLKLWSFIWHVSLSRVEDAESRVSLLSSREIKGDAEVRKEPATELYHMPPALYWTRRQITYQWSCCRRLVCSVGDAALAWELNTYSANLGFLCWLDNEVTGALRREWHRLNGTCPQTSYSFEWLYWSCLK